LFTDVEGSTRRWEADAEGMHRLGSFQLWPPVASAAGAANNAGSARMALGATSPTRVATRGVLLTVPCMPHSLLRTEKVCTPLRLPSGWGCKVSDFAAASGAGHTELKC
jgi:hypothetical protein